MSAQTLVERRARLLLKIAAGRLGVIEALDVVLDPVRKLDTMRAAFGRGVERSRAAAPMLFPLVPVGLLALIRGRRAFGGLLRGALRLSLRGAALARIARQAGPLVAAATRYHGHHAGPRDRQG